jgi:hypothetical protein
MKWKEFLKPTLAKVILLLILIIITTLFFYTVTSKSSTANGFPFQAYSCFYTDTNFICQIPNQIRISAMVFPIRFGNFVNENYLFEGLLLDMILWYLVSCLIVWIYNVVNKKK